MIANLLIIAFLIAMAYWWGLQGLFSAFLHLLLVIVAMSIAAALWEPLVLNFLIHRMPAYAWSLGLIGPFVLALIAMRSIMDFVVKANMHFPPMINMIGGGFLGFIAAMFIAGFTVIGLGFLPVGIDLAGYQPLAIEGNGTISQNGKRNLWIPVDRQAAALLRMLSGGSFTAGHPMREYKPDLAMQAALYRMRYDANASLVATPPSVSLDKVVVAPTPVKELTAGVAQALQPLGVARPGQRLVVIDTVWTATAGVYDSATLYLPPTQIRLMTSVTGPTGVAQFDLHAPVGFATLINPQTGTRHFQAVADGTTSAYGQTQKDNLAWAFLIDADQEPHTLFVRQLRLPMPDAILRSGEQVAAILGVTPQAQADPTAVAANPNPDTTGQIGPREGPLTNVQPVQAAVAKDIPGILSKNQANSLKCEGNGIVSGTAESQIYVGSLAGNLRIDSIWCPSHQRILRVQLDRDQAQSLLGATRALAASIGGPQVVDSRGQTWLPIGFLWNRNGTLNIRIDRDNPIRSARDLPTADMAPGNTLFLYFVLSPGVTVTEFNIGGQSKFPLNVPVN
jgi:hypothetical protein